MSVYSVRVIFHRFFTFCKKMRAVVIARGFRVNSLRNTSVRNVSFDPKKVKVISLDVTGTILLHKTDVVESYAECLKWSHIAIPHTDELRKPFKDAYRAALTKYPCFGHAANMSGRDWWKLMLEDFLLQAKIKATHHQFERFFRRVYQHYGSLKGYETLPDAVELLTWIATVNDTPGMRSYSTGIISNTPTRTVDTVLPLLDLHNHFDWFLCCREIGVEKPNVGIYDEAHRRAEHYVPGLLREEMLHIGDNFTTDFCGARAAGLQALYLDRSGNDRIGTYQEWLKAPDYEGKSEADIKAHTITSLRTVKEMLTDVNKC